MAKAAIKNIKIIASNLVNWFLVHQRALPWRETRDPYRIWISEVMLQQTQVATVIPYYLRFLKRFPTVESLARAPLDDVLILWSGLGYYSRARNLHRGAQMVVERFAGKIPTSRPLIREIPGIGEYTAGAVLSIAYGLPEALVDGNVSRVLSRMFLIKGDGRKGTAKESTWTLARQLVAACHHPGNLNQALMELGATICSPGAPDCGLCPLKSHCMARKLGVQGDYPEPPQKAKVPIWNLRAWIVERGESVLLLQRQPKGLFGGLWEVPTERIRQDLRLEAWGLNCRAVPQASSPKPQASFHLSHTLSHRLLHIEVCHADKMNLPADYFHPETFSCWSGQYTGARWVKPAVVLDGGQIGVSSIQKKIIQAFRLSSKLVQTS